MRNNIPDHYKDQLLDCLLHHMDLELRGRVMIEVPEAYNAYFGKEYARVVRASDGTALKPGMAGIQKIEEMG